MELAYYSLIGAITTLLVLVVLFRFEDVRGRRLVLAKVRGVCDRGFDFISYRFQSMLRHIGEGTVRQTSHFLAHRFLQVLLAATRSFEASLRHLQLKNRQVAHSDKVRRHVDQKMSEVKSHADSIKMTPEEKRKKRRELLK